MDIFQKAITPDMPRVLAEEQIYVYVPTATSTNAGIASYKREDFKVANGEVSLRWPISSLNQGPLNTSSLIKVQDSEFEYSGNVINLNNGNDTVVSTTSEIKLRRDLRDAYQRPDFVMLDENYFPRTIVEKDGKQYYKYNTSAIHYIIQQLTEEQKTQARQNIDASSVQVVSKINNKVDEIEVAINKRVDEILSSQVLTVNGKIGHVVLKNSDIENDTNYSTVEFVNSSIATNTATFRGTYNSLSELEAYAGKKDINDYAFVIEVDSVGNTLYKRYKYVDDKWNFEYTLNNSSFTEAQWAAINSGITDKIIELIRADITNLQNDKADKTTTDTLRADITNLQNDKADKTTTDTLRTDITYLQNNKVDKTITINTKPLSSNVVLVPTDIGAYSQEDGDALTGKVDTNTESIKTASSVATDAKRIAQEAMDLITEGIGSQVLVNGESVAVFNADTKADVIYVDERVADLVGSAPGTLDTLEELAGALKDNADIVTVLENAINTKANKADIEPTIEFAESERQKSKNLFDISKITSVPNYFYVENNTLVALKWLTYTNETLGDLADLVVGKTYTFSFKTTSTRDYIYLRNALEGVAKNIYKGTTVVMTQTLLNSTLGLYCYDSSAAQSATYSEIQIEEGAVATEYQPYNGVITHNNDAPVVFAESERQKSKNNGPILHEEDITDLKSIRTLPYEYQKVEYIESTGTQYIDTGVTGKTGYITKAKLMLTEIPNDGCIIGSRTSGVRIYPMHFYPGNYGYGYGVFWNSEKKGSANTVLNVHSILLASHQELIINNVRIYTSSDSATYDTGYNMTIFGLNYNGTVQYFSKCKLYSMKLYEGSIIVRDFIPCYRKSDGEIGLYDLVNNVFYTNQGTGTFLKGENVYLSNVARRDDAAIKFAKSEYKKSRNLLRIVQDYTRTTAIAEGTLTINKDTQTITINGPTGTGGWLADINIVEPVICKANTFYTVSVHNVPTGSITGTKYKQFYLHFDSDKPWQNIDISNGSYKTFMFTEDTLLDGLTFDLNRENTYTNVSFNVQLEEGIEASSWQYPTGPILHKVDLSDRVAFTKYAGISVAGTTKDVYKYDPTTIYAPNGLIMGGTALAAGLVTRGICGVNTPNESGYCTKDNLYINYDGSNTYSSTRQLILQAENSGTHYGNNLYQYAAARGDAVKNYCDATYLKINTSTVPSGQTLTVAGVLNASSAGSFNYSGIETGGTSSNNMLRCVWFSHSSEKGRPIIAEDFKYNPYSKLLKVNGTIECSTINLLV